MTHDDDQLSQFEALAVRLADAARRETLPRFRGDGEVFNKAGIWFDPVTDADREAERAQRRMIEAVFPGHRIIGEEFGESGGEDEYCWVLDPVDGTRSFVCGLTSWATLIGLERRGVSVLGVVDQPFTDERWIGFPDCCRYEHAGTSCETKTSRVKSVAKARLSTTDPRKTAYFTAREANAFDAVAKKAQVTRFGLDAYAYAMLAIGQVDLVIEAGLQHHDWAALAPVVRGAGGVITNWQGDALGADDRGEVVAAATPELHAEAIDMLAAAM